MFTSCSLFMIIIAPQSLVVSFSSTCYYGSIWTICCWSTRLVRHIHLLFVVVDDDIDDIDDID